MHRLREVEVEANLHMCRIEGRHIIAVSLRHHLPSFEQIPIWAHRVGIGVVMRGSSGKTFHCTSCQLHHLLQCGCFQRSVIGQGNGNKASRKGCSVIFKSKCWTNDSEVHGRAHGWSVQQQGAHSKILVADSNLGNLERGPAFARRFNQAWPPTIPDACLMPSLLPYVGNAG